MQHEIGPFRFSNCAGTVTGRPTDKEWEAIFRWSIWIARHHPFWIGDLIDAGERVMGDRIYALVPDDPHAVDLVSRHVGVCRRVKKADRNRHLWFTHHREVASLSPENQRRMLKAAEEAVMGSGELRKLIRSGRN